MTDLTQRRPRLQDVTALAGILAVIEAEIRSHPMGELSDWMLRIGVRLSNSGLLSPDPHAEELSTAVGDLNQRLRYVLGEYDEEEVQAP